MSEKEAWEYLADKIEFASMGPGAKIVGWHIERCYAQGMCESIEYMHYSGIIERSTFSSMQQRINCERYGRGRSGYWWPRDVAGAKERVAFCRQMAQECEVQQ